MVALGSRSHTGKKEIAVKKMKRLMSLFKERKPMGSRRVQWPLVGIAMAVLLLMMPSLASAAALSVSGAPRALNTLEQSWPTWACMNPLATGGAGSYRWDFSSNPGSHFTIDSTYGTVTPVTPLAAGAIPSRCG